MTAPPYLVEAEPAVNSGGGGRREKMRPNYTNCTRNEVEAVEQYNKIFESLTTEQQEHTDKQIEGIRKSVDGIGYIGAKVLYLAVAEFMASSPAYQAQMRGLTQVIKSV